MAGRGPAKKADAARRRRNKDEPEVEVEVEAAAEDSRALPKSYKAWDSATGKVKSFQFLTRTRAWYRNMCESPELKATLTTASYLVLQDLAVLQDRWYRTGSLEIRKELRLGLAAFGATPVDAKRVGVQLKPKPVAKPKPATAEGSRFEGLRAV